jgi:hypothetical protein
MLEVATILRSRPPQLSEVGALLLTAGGEATNGAETYTHATATAMHFPANAGLIFLTDELTNDRYLVDTGATLSIVPCSKNTSPSGPLLKGADGQPIPSWGFIQKTV